jgi:hypothetical protein
MRYSEIQNYRKGIGSSIVLTILTCGIYNLFWQNHQIKTVNLLLEKKVLSFWKWFFFTLITCGLYHIYHEYLMGKYIVEIQYKIGKPAPSTNLPVIALILSIIGLPFITDAIEQKELNEIIDYIVEKKF